MTSSSRRPLSRGEKSLLVGVPVLLVFAVGVTVILGRLNAKATLTFPKPVSLPQPNGFDLYVAAANAITPAKPSVDAVDDRENLRGNPTLAAQRYSLARKTAWLQANATGFALFRQAQKAQCRHPLFKPPLGNPNYGKLRQLARYKVIEANAFKLRGDWNGLTNSALDILELGADISQGAPIMGKLVAVALESYGKTLLSSSDDPIAKLNASQDHAAIKRLESIRSHRQNYAATLENERWVEMWLFDWLRHTPKWRKDVFWQRDWGLPQKLSGFLIPESEIVAQINQNYDDLIADAKQRYSAPKKLIRQGHPGIQIFTSQRSYRPQAAQADVPLDMLLLRLALRAHQLENGAFPANLNQLAPKYLAKIPTDIYADNAPFHYANKGKTYLLYSIGPDGKDDGGTPIKWRNGASGANIDGLLPPLFPDGIGDYVAGANS